MAWTQRAKLPLIVLGLTVAAVGACMLPTPSPSHEPDGESFEAWVQSQSLSGASGAGQSITRLPNAAPIGAAGPVRRVHIVAGPNGQPVATYPTTPPRNALELGVYDLRRSADGALEYVRPTSETTRYMYSGPTPEDKRRAVSIHLGKVTQTQTEGEGAQTEGQQEEESAEH